MRTYVGQGNPAPGFPWGPAPIQTPGQGPPIVPTFLPHPALFGLDQVGQNPYDSFPGPYGPPAYGYHPQPCHWDPNATRFGGAWVCDGYVAGAPQVGQAPPKTTGTVKQPDHQWRFPWWGYQYGWPWYGQQTQCYFDPWAGVWVCPSSPWVYQPVISTWYYTAPWWARRRHPSLMLG